MNENQVITQLERLKSIKPNSGWVFSTRAQILSQGRTERFSIMGWAKARAVLVLPSMAVICLTAIFLFNNIISLQTASQEAQALEAMASNLNEIGFNVLQAVNDLENIQEPGKMVEVQQIIASAIANGEKIVENAKQMAGEQAGLIGAEELDNIDTGTIDPEVLAVVAQVEEALENMKQTYVQKQMSLAQELIQDLAAKSLTLSQELLLQQAQEYYNNNEFDRALIKAIEVSQVK